MNISIRAMHLSYFKGIETLSMNFSEGVNEVSGNNGTGKTTLKDAFLWCLFGKNSEGRSDFGIMTLGADGKKIPNVEHSVRLSLNIDGTIRDFKRTYTEEYVTRRGKITDEVKHNVKYSIDGMEMPKRDYDNYVASLVNEATFKAITDPTYFPSLHWKEQRAMLERIAGDIDYSAIDGNSRFDAITKESQFKSIEEQLQHISYNIRLVKEKIDAIPARIEEQNNTCPEPLDWNDIEARATALAKKIAEQNDMLHSLRNGQESAVRKSIRQQIEFQDKRIDNMRISANNMASEHQRQFDSERTRLANILNSQSETLKALNSKIQSYKTLVDRAEDTLRDLDEQTKEFNIQWKERVNIKFTRPETPVCPLCHRPFEGVDLEAEIKKMEERFNIDRANAKEELLRKAEKIKQDRATAEATIKTCHDESSQVEEDIKQTEAIISDAQKEMDKLLSGTILSSTELLEQNPSYKQATDKKRELEAQLESETVTDNSETIAELASLINTENGELTQLQKQIGTKAIYDAHQSRIEELRTENETLIIQLDELLEKRDLVVEYQAARDNLLEESVNKAFSVVRFRLFDTLNDGTRKPNCICWVSTRKGLVEFADANSAMKLNAGRDILSAISKYYDVYAPCFSDNAESTNTFMPIKSQDIRLYVSRDNSLTIK